MRVLPFVNQKGGCGKTTGALNLAGTLASRGRRVVLVDLDPQAHATLGLGLSGGPPGSLEVLRGECELTEALRDGPGGIRVLTADPRLAEFEEEAERRLEPERALRRALARSYGQIDDCIVDCPARIDGVLPANALAAATTVILAVETGAFALQGALRALEVIEESRAAHGTRFSIRVLATLFDRRTRFARELLVALQSRFEDGLFQTAIRTSVRLREAAACGLPIHMLAPRSRAAQDFASLADEVERLPSVESPKPTGAEARRRGIGVAQARPAPAVQAGGPQPGRNLDPRPLGGPFGP